MNSFREYLAEDESVGIQETLKQLLIIESTDINELFEDSGELINESRFSDLLKKAGLKVHKQKGLIGYLKSASKGIAKLFVSAIKGDKEGVKSVMNSVDRADVIDFLLKLDMATLHLVTAPIHTIDAITGWDIAANLKSSTEHGKSITDKIAQAIDFLKGQIKSTMSGKLVKQHHGNLDKISSQLV